ncbi:DUF4440 domain-containing protein [Arsenicicoccus dermatophilus]|uniref:nuclear transport factor 2 family protein n=1 Tax=Arsenicicoccus dermatophilus TaxID=1076331 RepID=UPI003916F958
MAAHRSDLDHVLRLERELQSPATRGNPERLVELLAPDFLEIGASGRRWDLRTILDLLAQETSKQDAAPIAIQDLHARALSDDVIQVFWESDRDGRRARRTSLWRHTCDGWRQVYHQGTPLP